MRTSNFEENNEEVNGNLQSGEPNDQQENNTSSSNLILNISSENESGEDPLNTSSEYELSNNNNKCRGCICYKDLNKIYCVCGGNKICCCLREEESQEDLNKIFDFLKNSEKGVSTENNSDSDVQICVESSCFPRPSLIEPVKTYQSKPLKRASSSVSTSSSAAAQRPKRFRTAKENRDYRESNEQPVTSRSNNARKRKISETNEKSDLRRNEFIDHEQEDPKPSTSTDTHRTKRNKAGTSSSSLQENTDPNSSKMSMYDYRLADPQLPSSTSYYTSSSTSKSSANVVTEEQQNTTNATTQNLLDSNKTIATLCNIGNSCYLNSVVYTLRFAPLFLHKLHHLIEDMATIYIKLNPTKHKSSSLGRNVSLWQGHNGRSWSSKDLASLGSITGNDSLPKNNRLIVTEKLHELYQNLHKNESSLNTEPFHAGTFLQAIQEVCSIFEGNQQQDAHECLMCILDSIRETCDTLATAIIENPEQLLAEYGLGSLIEESRASDEVIQQQQSLQQLQQQVSQGSSKGFGKFLSRKSKRKKSDDESTVPTTSPVYAEKPPESPSKERGGGGDTNTTTTGQSEIMNNHDGSGDGSSAATSPTSTIDAKLNMKNAVLKVLAGEHDVNDKQKLKENVCKLLGLNFFCEDFEGVTVSSIKCLTCEQVKTLKEKMIDISVPITGHENPDAMSNPQSFFQNSCITKEYFRGENKYRCENCFGYTEAIRSITYEILPRLLVIHLKRFSGGMEKINSFIPTPFTLKCFCNSCFNKPDEEKLHIYKLYSVITHVGATMSVGHYVAYTCALDIQNEYRICTNDRTKIANLFQNNSSNGTSSNDINASSQSGSNSSLATTASSNTNGDKSTGSKMIKRLFFSGKKTNSSNDLKSNSFKSNVNGLVNKVVANGMEKLNLGINNTTGRVLGSSSSNGTYASTCQGQKCCGIKESKLVSNNNGTFISYVNGNLGHMNGSINGSHQEMDTLVPPSQSITKPSSSDLSIASSSNSSTTGNNPIIDDDATVTSTTTTTNATGGKSSNTQMCNNITQDHWYMCDDDKIKVMQQQQFEEHLSPTRKNMITPYLLFYARFDAHPL